MHCTLGAEMSPVELNASVLQVGCPRIGMYFLFLFFDGLDAYFVNVILWCVALISYSIEFRRQLVPDWEVRRG